MPTLSAVDRPRPTPLLPIFALVANAAVWGTVWWPMRRLQAAGLHPLWTTACIFTLATLTIVVFRPQAVLQVLRTPALWVLVLTSGATNAAFNWAIVIGDVVRVILLFYLMPLWSVPLARLLLNERLGAVAALRVALGVAGAVVVLWPANGAGSSWAMPRPHGPADWLGLAGGLAFALNNVMLRREAAQPQEGRALAMFFGGAIVAVTLATLLASRDPALWPPAPALGWVAAIVVLAGVFLLSNFGLQYGAARLPAQITAVVMLTEVLFAAFSAVALGGATPTSQTLLGGALIVAAAVLAALGPPPR